MAIRRSARVQPERPVAAQRLPYVLSSEKKSPSGLKVGPADDKYERLADAAAAAVVRRLMNQSGDMTPAPTSGTASAATIQRSAVGAPVPIALGVAPSNVIRRLSVDKPLKRLTSIDVLPGGASGKVAQVSDGGTPVMVKVDQGNAAEVIAADRLARKSGAKAGKYKVKAPKSRIALGPDLTELQLKAADTNVMKSTDVRNWVTGLGGTKPAIISEMMGGETVKDTLAGASGRSEVWDDVTQKSTAVFVAPDPGLVSVVKTLVTSSSAVKALAKGVTSDVAMGMADRVLGMWNPENFMFDAASKRFSFVDNTQSSPEGTLVTSAVQDGRAGFDAWTRMAMVSQLVNDLDGLSVKFATKYCDGLLYPFKGHRLTKTQYNASPMKTVHDELRDLIADNQASLTASARSGLESGRQALLKNLANAAKLTLGVPADKRLEAATSLLARRELLMGKGADEAWRIGGEKASKLLKIPVQGPAPKRPKNKNSEPRPILSSMSKAWNHRNDEPD